MNFNISNKSLINNNLMDDEEGKLFYRDLLLSERLRVKILLSLLGMVLLFVIFLFVLFEKEYLALFKDKDSLFWISVSMGFFILYEFILYNAINYFIRTNRNFPTFGRYGNTLFEVSIPSILMFVIAGSVNPFIILTGPTSYAYFIFIILSTLRLDFRLSFLTGLAAAFEYSFLSYYFLNNSQEPINTVFYYSNILFLSKSLIMFLCGVAAGFVSLQIKKRMISTLKLVEERNKIISVFGQQVSPEIVDELLNHKQEEKGVIKDVCIMFLDIRNFTSMAEKKNPEDIVEYQNIIFGLVGDIINKHKGIINQFLGDGFMATFGAPITRGNDCQHAINAAKEIILEIEKANKKGLIIPTRVGIGIHYGEAVTGNVGSDARKQYSITGNVVILASRIEQLNKEFDTQLLISSDVLNISNIPLEKYHSLGPVKVKGREEPIEIFKIV